MEKYEEIERALIKNCRKGVWRKFVKCINEYKMMNEGDRVAALIDGTARSMTMAKCIQEIHRHGKFTFELKFIRLSSKKEIEDIASAMNVPLEFIEIEAAAWARNKGYNKLALCDCFDDVIETILVNLIKKGEIKTPLPADKVTYDGVEIIRPMYNVKEKDINAFAKRCEVEFVPYIDENPDITGLIKRFRKTNTYIEKNILSSVHDVNLETLIGYHKGGYAYNFLDDYDERG